MAHSDTARQVFARELGWISDPAIQQFVLDVFDKFGHDYFWTRPASLSGKYHPRVSQGPGGLIRHVRLACFHGYGWNRALLMDVKEKSPPNKVGGKYGDVVIAALILHDLMKEGDPTLAGNPERMGYAGTSLIGGCHGVDLANAIWNRMLNQQGTPEQILILYGIGGHMGIWTKPPEWVPSNIPGALASAISQVVHAADYAASRKVDEEVERLAREIPGMPEVSAA
jgi:hypothetical protein